MPTPDYLAKLESALLAACPAILMEWLPGGRQDGAYYTCANITGGHGKSFKVYTSGPKAGRWADYAGEKGEAGSNLTSLYAAVRGISWGEAFNVLCDEYGIVRAKRQRVEYQVIHPVPETAYECSSDGLPELPNIPHTKQVSAFWTYFDRQGNLLCFRIRVPRPGVTSVGKPNKDVLPLTWCRDKATGEESWQLRELPDPLPLYNLMELTSKPPKILIVQGEKKVVAASRLLPDWTATCNPGGDKKTSKSDWSEVIANSNARVVIWPDNDLSGMNAAAEVGSILNRSYEMIRVDPQWPKSYDIADLEAAGWDQQRTEEFLENNLTMIHPEVPVGRPEANISGKDPLDQMQSVFEAMEQIPSEIFTYTFGAAHVRRNNFGLLSVSRMNGMDFRAWAAKKLFTFYFNGSDRRDGKTYRPITEELSNAIIFHAPEHLPNLRRFADIPIFTAEGKLLETSGYHPESKIYLSVPRGYEPDLPAEEAWGVIDDLLADFPFDTESDKTAAVSFVLTAILRDRISGPTPLYRFEAPSPGTGKSLLCEALCEIITPFPQEYGLSDNSEEVEKVITTALMRSPAVVRFDNVKKLDAIPGRALTSLTWGGRILGESKDVQIPITNLWAATINNPEMTNETFRRTVRVRLDAKMSNPDTRPGSSFRHPALIKYVRENRALLVSAFVAVARSGITHQTDQIPEMGSYEAWASTLAPVLEINSYTEFLKNREQDREEVTAATSEGMEILVQKWLDAFGGSPVTASEVFEIAQGIPSVPGFRSKDGRLDARSFSYFLRGHRDKMITVERGEVTIRKASKSGSTHRWKLEGKLAVDKSENSFLPYKDSEENAQF